jgi:hypothetical protein
MDLPRREDINVHDSLDEISASDHFYGKTLEEAEALFREDAYRYQEDLMWMGPRAFAFYLPAVSSYLRSDDSAGDDALVDALYNIFEFRMAETEFPLASDTVRRIVDYVVEHFEKFAVDTSIYGDLLDRYRKLQARLEGAR